MTEVVGTGGAALTSSTPDALWAAPANRVLRPTAIAASGLTRGTLLDRCSLSVPVGMRLLVVGDPEASASMLLRVLAGLSRPSRGRVRIAGLREGTGGGWGQRMAYLGPQPGIHGWMTPREALTLAGRLLDLPVAEIARRIERAIAWVRIPLSMVDRPVGHSGPPLAQRVGLAAALIADPEVLLLDEPLRALEAHERARLLRLPGQRRTIMLASNYPASEAGLATHVALLREGRVAMLARTADLEAVGLPLSMRGILSLADLRRSGPAGGASPHPASARGT
jgi:ABC-2 type transport system ATP-binding protein